MAPSSSSASAARSATVETVCDSWILPSIHSLPSKSSPSTNDQNSSSSSAQPFIQPNHSDSDLNSGPQKNSAVVWPLGPLDQIVGGFVVISVVFVYPRLRIDERRLKVAIQRVVDQYPLLAGRLDLSNGTNIVVLGQDKETSEGSKPGAQLRVAECRSSIGHSSLIQSDKKGNSEAETSEQYQIRLEDLPEDGNALFIPWDPAPDGYHPVLSVQLTHFHPDSSEEEDEGHREGHEYDGTDQTRTDVTSTLGIRLNHAVCDGDGFFQAVQAIASAYRDVQDGEQEARFSWTPSPPYYPHLKQSGFQQTLFHIPPTENDVVEAHVDPPDTSTDQTSVSTQDSTEPPTPSSPWIGGVLHIDIPPDQPPFAYVAAKAFQTVYRARRRVYKDGEISRTDLLTPANLRLRSRLDLPDNYIHNAGLTLFTTLDIQDDTPLDRIVQQVVAMTRSLKDVKETVQWIADQEKPTTVASGFQYGTGSLMLSDWRGFDSDIEFEKGCKPAFVAPPFSNVTLLDGLGYILPSSDMTAGDSKRRGADVYLALRKDVWEAIDRLGA